MNELPLSIHGGNLAAPVPRGNYPLKLRNQFIHSILMRIYDLEANANWWNIDIHSMGLNANTKCLGT